MANVQVTPPKGNKKNHRRRLSLIKKKYSNTMVPYATHKFIKKLTYNKRLNKNPDLKRPV